MKSAARNGGGNSKYGPRRPEGAGHLGSRCVENEGQCELRVDGYEALPLVPTCLLTCSSLLYQGVAVPGLMGMVVVEEMMANTGH